MDGVKEVKKNLYRVTVRFKKEGYAPFTISGVVAGFYKDEAKRLTLSEIEPFALEEGLTTTVIKVSEFDFVIIQ